MGSCAGGNPCLTPAFSPAETPAKAGGGQACPSPASSHCSGEGSAPFQDSCLDMLRKSAQSARPCRDGLFWAFLFEEGVSDKAGILPPIPGCAWLGLSFSLRKLQRICPSTLAYRCFRAHIGQMACFLSRGRMAQALMSLWPES